MEFGKLAKGRLFFEDRGEGSFNLVYEWQGFGIERKTLLETHVRKSPNSEQFVALQHASNLSMYSKAQLGLLGNPVLGVYDTIEEAISRACDQIKGLGQMSYEHLSDKEIEWFARVAF